jgi:hypothetical protein
MPEGWARSRGWLCPPGTPQTFDMAAGSGFLQAACTGFVQHPQVNRQHMTLTTLHTQVHVVASWLAGRLRNLSCRSLPLPGFVQVRATPHSQYSLQRTLAPCRCVNAWMPGLLISTVLELPGPLHPQGWRVRHAQGLRSMPRQATCKVDERSKPSNRKPAPQIRTRIRGLVLIDTAGAMLLVCCRCLAQGFQQPGQLTARYSLQCTRQHTVLSMQTLTGMLCNLKCRCSCCLQAAYRFVHHTKQARPTATVHDRSTHRISISIQASFLPYRYQGYCGCVCGVTPHRVS